MSKPATADTKKRKTKVIVVDDHPIVREHLSALINEQKDMVTCCQAANAREAMKAIADHKPDMAIVDLSLKETHGLELIKDLVASHEGLPILVLSMHDESLFAERAFRAGARGYVNKQEPSEHVMEAIRQVAAGEVYVSKEFAARIIKKATSRGQVLARDPVEALTDREMEVFQMIGQGKATREIAHALRLDVKTVETYRARIKDKLGITNAAALMQRALQWVEDRAAR